MNNFKTNDFLNDLDLLLKIKFCATGIIDGYAGSSNLKYNEVYRPAIREQDAKTQAVNDEFFPDKRKSTLKNKIKQ